MTVEALRSPWTSMNARCKNPEHRAFVYYGGRGIRVEFASFKEFSTWAIEAGYRPGLWLDRINNDGPYSPDNCRWSTPQEQQRNRRNNRVLMIFGEEKCVSAWTEDIRLATTPDSFRQRIKAGWDPEQALTTSHNSTWEACSRGHRKQGKGRCLVCYNDGRRERRRKARL